MLRRGAVSFGRAMALLVVVLVACSHVEAPAQSSAGAGSGGAGGSAVVACPESPDTWPMVGVLRGDGSSFCIDSREVTNEQYAAFLARAPVVALLPRCVESPDRTPKESWPPTPERARHPVGAVDWCDAQAFCLASGKRLCGDATGNIVSLTYDDGNKTEVELDEDTTMETWVACTGDGATIHPYGNEYLEGACPYAQFEETVAADADSGCDGGYEGIHFLEGNVQEWEARCKFEVTGEGLSGAACTTRGTYACGANRIDTGMHGAGVTDWTRYSGIRCCADALSLD